MKHLNYYNYSLSINGKKFDYPLDNINFVISDSIYTLYNEINIQFDDPTGNFSEYLIFTEGTELELTFGVREQVKKCKYTVVNPSLPRVSEQTNLSGRIIVNAVNEWYNRQEIKTKAYSSIISDIVTEIVANVGFQDIDIDITGNKAIWYQLQMNDAKFINDILLKYAYASNTNKTPFYAYITSDNIFHFRNLSSLMDTKEVVTLFSNYETEDQLIDTARSINNLQKFQRENRVFRHRDIYSISRTTGDLVKIEDSINEYPSNKTNENLPIINDNNTKKSVMFLGFSDSDLFYEELNKGKYINVLKDDFFIDNFKFVIPLSKTSMNLKSGDIINLKIFRKEDKIKFSKIYSGKYLIESYKQFWGGDAGVNGVELSVVRKSFNCPSSLVYKSEFLTMV